MRAPSSFPGAGRCRRGASAWAPRAAGAAAGRTAAAAFCGALRPGGAWRRFAALGGALRRLAALCGALRPLAALCGPAAMLGGSRAGLRSCAGRLWRGRRRAAGMAGGGMGQRMVWVDLEVRRAGSRGRERGARRAGRADGAAAALRVADDGPGRGEGPDPGDGLSHHRLRPQRAGRGEGRPARPRGRSRRAVPAAGGGWKRDLPGSGSPRRLRPRAAPGRERGDAAGALPIEVPRCGLHRQRAASLAPTSPGRCVRPRGTAGLEPAMLSVSRYFGLFLFPPGPQPDY